MNNTIEESITDVDKSEMEKAINVEESPHPKIPSQNFSNDFKTQTANQNIRKTLFSNENKMDFYYAR